MVHQEPTTLFKAYQQGDEEALGVLLPKVYEELRLIAHRQLRREYYNETFNTTALVHEAYIRLINQQHAQWQDRAQFFAIAANLMRQILIDYARKQKALKRGGGQRRISLDEQVATVEEKATQLLALDEALTQLKQHNERLAQLVEYRFFGGMTVEETAAVLDISLRTAHREWVRAKAYIYQMMQAE